VRAHVDAAIAKRGIAPLADGSVDVTHLPVEGEAGRNHADHRVSDAVQREGFADDVGRRAEPALPESPAENDNGSGSDAVVVCAEGAAEDWLDTKRREEARGN